MDIFRFKKHTNFNYCCEFRKFKQVPEITITKHNITITTFSFSYISYVIYIIFSHKYILS